MRIYRIADARYQPETGEGARLYGGRWNSPGRAVIYGCSTHSGAMLEKLVHTNGRMPKHQVTITFECPDSLKPRFVDAALSQGWDAADLAVSRALGDAWLEKAPSLLLSVPSVVFAVERNVLINPAHKDFRRVKVVSVEPVRWDARLFAAGPHR